jgi:glyoxylase-like metal-dependent hydrolase (beta-lactamase superfamily II)
VAAVVARYGVPVWAHADAAAMAAGDFAVTRTLAGGELLPLGTSPDGMPDWTLEVVYTPGHAPGHLAFRESRYGAVLAGDMVSTVSTILVAPPDGHLRTYLDSLRRLRALPAATLYPSHGPAKRDSHAVLDMYLAHRAMREGKIVAALGPVPRDLDAILAQAYDDVAPEALPLARRALAGGLVKLCEDGVAVAVNGGWRRT